TCDVRKGNRVRNFPGVDANPAIDEHIPLEKTCRKRIVGCVDMELAIGDGCADTDVTTGTLNGQIPRSQRTVVKGKQIAERARSDGDSSAGRTRQGCVIATEPGRARYMEPGLRVRRPHANETAIVGYSRIHRVAGIVKPRNLVWGLSL